MIYVVMGQGTMPVKEAAAILEDCWAAAPETDDGVDISFLVEAGDSQAIKTVYRFLTKNEIPFSLLNLSEDETIGLPDEADEILSTVEELTDWLATAEAEEQEVKVLALWVNPSEEVEEDTSLFELLAVAAEGGASIFSMNDAMQEVKLATEGDELEEDELEEEDELADDELADDDDLEEDSFQAMTLPELRALVKERGVTPEDGRCRDSIIAALLGVKPSRLPRLPSPSSWSPSPVAATRRNS